MKEHIRARCSICGAEGVDGIIHETGCRGSTPAYPLILLDRWEEDDKQDQRRPASNDGA